jgi:hypothetical protein
LTQTCLLQAGAGRRPALSVEACLSQAGFFASKAFGYFWPSKVVKGKIYYKAIKVFMPFKVCDFLLSSCCYRSPCFHTNEQCLEQGSLLTAFFISVSVLLATCKKQFNISAS